MALSKKNIKVGAQVRIFLLYPSKVLVILFLKNEFIELIESVSSRLKYEFIYVAS